MVQRRLFRSMILLFLLSLLAVGVAFAQSGNSYWLSWWSVDSGGGSSQGGGYALNATIGQADAGTLKGGGYTLAGGYWSAAPSAPVPVQPQIFLPLVLR